MPEQPTWWGSLNGATPILAYRYRPNNGFLLDSIERALQDGALWMSPLSSQDDLTEASVAVRPTVFADDKERKRQALARLATFIIQSNTALYEAQNGTELSNSDLNSWIDREVRDSFRTHIGDRLLTASDEELPDLVQEARSMLRCACFVESPTIQLLWANYASNHSGCCLEYEDYYNYNFHIFNLSSPKPIEYSDEDKTLDRYDIWEALAFLQYSRRIEAGALSVMSRSDPRVEACKKLFLTKPQEWSWQKEFRVVDFGNEQGYASWPFLKLKRIIFGARCPPDLIARITDKFSDQLIFSKVVTLPGQAQLTLTDL